MGNNTYRSLLRQGTAQLENAAAADAAFDARCLLEWCAGLDRTHLILAYGEIADDALCSRYRQAVLRRASGVPLQYILGSWDFFGRLFRVREGVLIPRPETEFLVEKAVRLLPENAVVYDVCSGTGCIGVSIALERPDVKVFLFEKYDVPFSVLQENIHMYHAQNVTPVLCDMLNGVPQGIPKPDGIVSNPPYVCAAEMAYLQPEVQREPREALDGGADGLLFYRALRDLWFPRLSENGFLSMECGESQPQTVAGWFPSAEIEPDYTGTERFVTAYRKGT